MLINKAYKVILSPYLFSSNPDNTENKIILFIKKYFKSVKNSVPFLMGTVLYFYDFL